jgi:hypothetical protein
VGIFQGSHWLTISKNWVASKLSEKISIITIGFAIG